MAFKSFAQYQEDKNGEFFVLPNDGDYADVIFLYKSPNDVLVGEVHYLSTSNYKGYVHCCGAGCPACNYESPNSKYKGIRLDKKIFIPLYNIQKQKIEFWDRSVFFEQVLQKSVFGPFPNPSETVFRVTRRGEAGSRDTKYDIQPVGRNSSMPYEKILADFNMTLPEGYNKVCIEMSASEMAAALASTGTPSDLQDYGYVPVPRGGASVESSEPAPTVSVPTPEYSAPPEVAPPSLPEYNSDSPADAAPIQAVQGDDSEDSLDDVKF